VPVVMRSCFQNVVLALSELSIEGDEKSMDGISRSHGLFSNFDGVCNVDKLIPTTDDQKTSLDNPTVSTW
jgi:hypothetical protein